MTGIMADHISDKAVKGIVSDFTYLLFGSLVTRFISIAGISADFAPDLDPPSFHHAHTIPFRNGIPVHKGG